MSMWNSFSSETQYILKGVSKKVGGELGDALLVFQLNIYKVL